MGTWFYNTPDWITLPLFVIFFVAGSLGLVLLMRPLVSRWAENSVQWDRVLGYTGSTFGVFFSILLALVAVSVYSNYTDAHSESLAETSQIGALYRGTNGLPDQLGDQLRASLRDYVNTVIDEDWPAQRLGDIPTASTAKINGIEDLIYSFDPKTFQDSAKFSQLLATFDAFIEARRDRIDATTLQLPGLFWLVIWIGAIINAILIAMIDVDSRRLHLIMAGMLALFVALVIFLTAEMDHPYAGSISVDPGDFERLLLIMNR